MKMIEGGQYKQVNFLPVSRDYFFSRCVPMPVFLSVCESGGQTSTAPKGHQCTVLWAAEMRFISRIQAVC